jgi:hypothetical protein
LGSVSKTDEYTAYALALLEMAEHAPSAIQKRRLLRIAEGWLDLADRLQKRLRSKRRDNSEHPLLKAKLGDDHTDV